MNERLVQAILTDSTSVRRDTNSSETGIPLKEKV